MGHQDDAAGPWWRGAAIYQVYPRSYADSDGDGIGDLPGLIARLDHIASLGVDSIWVCPFYASPQRDFGYDVADHCAVDPIFGTLPDAEALIAAAHARGLRVLFDLVAGHTSDRHPWFQASRRDRAAPTADWYVWADPAPDGTPPNNWLGVFGGSAWTWEPRRRQYYLHHFLPSQPALNLHHPAVLDALCDVARFWLDRGADGFRIDAVDFLTHDVALRSNPPATPWGGVVPAKPFALQDHRHDMIQPETLDVLRRLRAVAEDYPGTALLGEVSSQPGPFGRIARYTAAPDLLHLAYTLGPLRRGFDHDAVSALVAEAVAVVEAGGWPCHSFSNHDVARAATRWAPDGRPDPRLTRLLLALLLTLPGSACLYQGEELGLPEAELREAEIQDPFGIAYWPEFKGRDGSRTPVPWHAAAPEAGFTSGRPWLPVPEAHRALAVDSQAADPASILGHCRALLRLRRREPALRQGATTLLALPPPLLGYTRQDAESGRALTMVFNLSGAAAVLPAALAALPALDPGAGLARGLDGFGVAMLAGAPGRAGEARSTLVAAD